MPLPSSNPINRLQVPVQSPTINLADYTPAPAATLQALSNGVALGNQLGDAIVLRPRQVQAAQAQADAAREAALTSQDVSQAQRTLLPLQTQSEQTLIPIRSQEEAARLGAQTTNDETENLLAAVRKTVAGNPDFANALKQQLLSVQAGSTATAAHDAVIAQGRQKTAGQEAQTNAFNTSTENNLAEDRATAAAQNATKEANVDKLTNDAVVAAGQSDVAAAPFKSSEVKNALEEGSRAAGVGQALSAKLGLANLITNGLGGGGTLSPDAVNKLYESASNKGVNIYNANGQGLRPLADVQRDLAQKSNIADAQKVLETTQAASDAAAQKLQTYQSLQSILNGPNNPSGGWRALPGTTLINDVLAGWGNTTAEHARLFDTYGKQLILDATGGTLGGRITDSDVAFLQKMQPTASNSDAVNRTLVAAGIATNQRVAQQSDFFNATVPKLGAVGAQRLWQQYVNANPIFDPQSSAGAPVINKNVLSPAQYLQAVQDPTSAQRTLAPSDPSSLPQFNPRNPPTTPFVVNKGQAIPNPVFWTPILSAHQQLFPSGPQTDPNAAQQRVRDIVTTPVNELLIRPASG